MRGASSSLTALLNSYESGPSSSLNGTQYAQAAMGLCAVGPAGCAAGAGITGLQVLGGTVLGGAIIGGVKAGYDYLMQSDSGPKTLQPGPNAGSSIPARGPDRDFTPDERDAINAIGQSEGCHTCGTKDPGTKSGNFVPDHQPPSAMNPTGAPQELYLNALIAVGFKGERLLKGKGVKDNNMKTSVLEWVNSSGGPLVCGDKEAVSDWKGTAGLSGSKFGQKGTDYQSSCLVNDYVGHMDGYGNSIVVLGDEPLQTAFFHTFTEDLAIARWIYADPSVDINKELRSFTESDSLQPAVTLEIASGSIVIFDASVEFKNCSSSIIEGINPGLYKLTSEKFQIGRKYSFLIHRILPAA